MTTSSLPFYERADAAIHDPNLQLALDRATVKFRTARTNAIEQMLEPALVRDRARAARASALARLDEHLDALAARVEEAGGHVHWAADGAAARRIIGELARERGVHRIVKGKSMASEEVHLNQALEEAGLRVVETDLGEYIIQLAGETPSHILAPAIHKTREQVSALFQEKLGMPPTDEIAVMTRTARASLRGEFLQADMGITGVNFGVAETGTIVLVTNEGNGRLSSGLPRIHVALMGIERVVATTDDLLVLLQVLARSATGQKLSVYTTLITGPARPDDSDGPEEFHLVLLDNGRSKLLGSEYAESLFCIRCGACLNVCPVYQEIGGHAYGSTYSGPIGAVLTPALEGLDHDNKWLPQASSLCGACQEVCPVRIAIPDMLLKLRRDSVAQIGVALAERLSMRAWRMGMSSATAYTASGRLARTGLRLLERRGRIRRLPPPLSAWTRSRDFPPFARRSFRERWADRHASTVRSASDSGDE
ncbi:MAG: Predicted L-lactate dehydrogenase, Iron-sulfur cluster-binding subunit YkgF [uncultured Chloroflexia bacterium]|uniref:Predicted L-lactate dehydrogenase, Iron-sulfur cluster-binding subunit YkgF n=1 Tax=uncultured Chloroflexia bacterium TaxID=1672391 RepID=A0A6J4K7Q4_9CHLR|nr:MAG: Predicted L-lactate dehydrogenase, Iron-sulfur cluster-binding subunit YkgF [uncultured Chloroflexia bacterium]